MDESGLIILTNNPDKNTRKLIEGKVKELADLHISITVSHERAIERAGAAQKMTQHGRPGPDSQLHIE